MSMKEVFERLLAGESLSEAEAESAFQSVFTGRANEVQVGAMLALMQAKGVTLDELVGGARVMRKHVTPVPIGDDLRPMVIDTCGTGGAAKTFNISTAVAIVAAACSTPEKPVLVAKHGGRSRTGRGSAEVLAQLGVAIDASPEVQARCLSTAGVCFCFAIHHHPAMKFAAGPRKSLGFPTIFNLLGPLTNPAGASRQLIGIYDAGRLRLMAEALHRLGAERAMVVHGDDGMDEITTRAGTTIAHLRNGSVTVERFDPSDFDIASPPLEALQATSVRHAADLILEVLSGRDGPARDIVVVNAAAALLIADRCASFGEAMQCAAMAIDSGRARSTLDQLIACSAG